MGRIDDIFKDLRATDRRAIMPFICAGHPTPDATPDILQALQDAGAHITEVGFPYSDPIADGPVIASAMHRALESGYTVANVFEQISNIRDRLSMGLIAMASISLVQRGGGPDNPNPTAFISRAKQAGFDGLIIPDLPIEEADAIRKAATEHDLTLSFLISPTTPPKRAASLAQASTGFVYLMARVGITGERRETPDISGMVQTIRNATDLPIACGFGISTAQHVASIVSSADAAIVGSALVRRLDQASDPSDEAKRCLTDLCEGLANTSQEPNLDSPEPTS